MNVSKTKIQIRGNCPCCGRDQAVVSSGLMSKHGYTVDNGWFNGVCGGDRHAPMQVQREVTDTLVASVRLQVASLLAHVEKLKAGTTNPAECHAGSERVNGKWQPKLIAWADANDYQRKEAVKDSICADESRARMGAAFATEIENLVNAVHGKPLREVEVNDGPAPILSGEQRVSKGGAILTATRSERGRVYFKSDGPTYRGLWIGTQTWRGLPTP